MDALSNFTSTSLGYLIALFMPGALGLYAVALFSHPVHRVLRTFYTSGSGLGLFFMVMVICLGIGVVLLALRGVIFERWLLRDKRLKPNEFARLSTGDVLAGFRAAVDENYRYHQSWGSLSFVIPAVVSGLIFNYHRAWGAGPSLMVALGGLLVEIVVWWAAVAAFEGYVSRSRAILTEKGGG
jgi:hypothetical protein